MRQSPNDRAHLIGVVAQVEANLGRKPAQVVVDSGFASRENIVTMAKLGVDVIGSLAETDPTGGQRQRGVSEQVDLDKFS